LIWKRLIVILFNKFLSKKVANIKIRHYKDLHLGNGGFVKKNDPHICIMLAAFGNVKVHFPLPSFANSFEHR